MKYLTLAIIALTAFSCVSSNEPVKSQSLVQTQPRIITLSGTLTEMVYALGRGKQIVGVDVTSTYPDEVAKLPNLGHYTQLNVESMLALNPTVVLAKSNELKPEILQQLTQMNIQVIEFKQDYSIEGTARLMNEIANELQVAFNVDSARNAMHKVVDRLLGPPEKKKVLFIYARGAGNVMIAGANTQMHKLIELAGAQNAVTEFEGFKPLTPEALVAANPDYVLTFHSGFESLEGIKGLLAIPGMQQTTAGRLKQFLQMDSQLLASFGPRVTQAAEQLNSLIYN